MEKTTVLKLFTALLVILCAGAADTQAEEAQPPELTLQARLQAFDEPTVGATVEIDSTVVTVGSLTLNLESGRAAPFLVAGEPVGMFFVGEGRLRYTSRDLDEASALRHNAKKRSGLRTSSDAEGTSLDGQVNEVLIWGRNVTLPDVQGAEAEPLDRDFDRHRQTFSKVRLASPAHMWVQQAIDVPWVPIAYAEISTGAERLVYTYDGVEARAETLDCLRSYAGDLAKGALYPISLSRQIIGSNGRAHQNPVALLSHADLEFTAEDDGHARLDVTETIHPVLRDQRVFRFSLMDQAYRERRLESWDLTAVLDATGEPVPASRRGSDLLVALDEKVERGGEYRIRFQIEGRILSQPGSVSQWVVVEPYPQFLETGTFMTLEALVRTKAPFVPVISAETVERGERDGYNFVRARIEKPVNFLMITGGRYRFSDHVKGERTVRVATYAMSNKRASKQLASLAHQVIEFYEEWLGPFPFKELQIVEANDLGYGIAPPAMMLITKEAFSPFFNEIYSRGINHRFAHEIAHQYWGHLIKIGSAREHWMSESFADYVCSTALLRMRGRVAFDKLFNGWVAGAAEAEDTVSIPMANRYWHTSDLAFSKRFKLLYEKGPLVLYALREEVGPDLFARYVRAYLDANRWKFGNSQDFMNALNQATGKDFSHVFERYLWGVETPNVKRP